VLRVDGRPVRPRRRRGAERPARAAQVRRQHLLELDQGAHDVSSIPATDARAAVRQADGDRDRLVLVQHSGRHRRSRPQR
jgi:hypothetical protein